ncbi:MAG: hypothetical protein D3906_02905 [Candidatus Electrothrix sp. AUS1_2]|nr:hypothetical protein [Candidatus Electrothrix sp. AUS1_2]
MQLSNSLLTRKNTYLAVVPNFCNFCSFRGTKLFLYKKKSISDLFIFYFEKTFSCKSCKSCKSVLYIAVLRLFLYINTLSKSCKKAAKFIQKLQRRKIDTKYKYCSLCVCI